MNLKPGTNSLVIVIQWYLPVDTWYLFIYVWLLFVISLQPKTQFGHFALHMCNTWRSTRWWLLWISVKKERWKLETWKSFNIIKQKTGGYGLGVELPPGLQVTFIEEVSQTAQNWKTSGSNVELASKIQNWLLQRQKETHALVTWFLQIYLWGVSILHQQSFLIFHIHLPVALYLYPGLSPSLLLTSIRSLVAYINPSTQKNLYLHPAIHLQNLTHLHLSVDWWPLGRYLCNDPRRSIPKWMDRYLKCFPTQSE